MLKPSQFVEFVRAQYHTNDVIPLHAPTFGKSERDNVLGCLDSTFVSTIGPYVTRFEEQFALRTGAAHAVAVMNGTAALHIALLLAGTQPGDLVIAQSLSFIATCNAISYCGAQPLFADVDRETLGLSPQAVDMLLGEIAMQTDKGCIEKASGRVIRACVPMHTFGHPVDLDALLAVCGKWGIALIEDAAEALGSVYKGRHVGSAGLIGTFSFNGNKIVTTGGGGMLTFADTALAVKAKHLTTTAKLPHQWEFMHDEIGYNYRMPNINAALGCAQLDRLDRFLAAKRKLSAGYQNFFANSSFRFCAEPEDTQSNYWLCAIVCADREMRDQFLKETNAARVSTRPVWVPMHRLPIYATAPRGSLAMTDFLADRIVNLPSSPILDF